MSGRPAAIPPSRQTNKLRTHSACEAAIVRLGQPIFVFPQDDRRPHPPPIGVVHFMFSAPMICDQAPILPENICVSTQSRFPDRYPRTQPGLSGHRPVLRTSRYEGARHLLARSVTAHSDVVFSTGAAHAVMSAPHSCSGRDAPVNIVVLRSFLGSRNSVVSSISQKRSHLLRMAASADTRVYGWVKAGCSRSRRHVRR